MSTIVYIVPDPSRAPHPEWGVPVELERLGPGERGYAGRCWDGGSEWTERSDPRSYRTPGVNTQLWSYILTWPDGGRGIVRVHDIQAALAATGARFDPEPPI